MYPVMACSGVGQKEAVGGVGLESRPTSKLEALY